MSVYVSNSTIYTGTDFEQTFNLEDSDSNSAKNISGYSGIAKLKRYEKSTNTSANFTVSFPNPTLGSVKISLIASQTINLNPGKYFYDLLLTDTQGTVTRVVEGTILVKRSITRD